MQKEKNMPTIDDFCKALEKSGKTKMSDQIRQAARTSMLLNSSLEGSLPEEMNDKLAVFRPPAISQCVVYDSIEDVANEKKAGDENA